MKAFVINAKHDVTFVEREKPTLQDENSVLVRVRSAGICGTDLHIYEGAHGMVTEPRVPGHEFAGEVVATGSAVKHLKVGDRVAHEPIRYCGECYACRRHMGNVCRHLSISGVHVDGGWQEYFVAPARQWHKLPDWMSWELGAMVEPYTIGAQVADRGDVQAGDVVLIHGGGPAGLMTADTVKHMGATVILSEVLEGRLQLARDIGVDYVVNVTKEDPNEVAMKLTDGEGPNVVIDAAGLPSMLAKGAEILSPAGRLVPMAFHGEMTIPIVFLGAKQLSIAGSRLQMDKFAPVIARFKMYEENAKRMITDVFSFTESDKAFAKANARSPETGKVVVRFD